jgi:SAM-dependent methyltransferase
MDTDLYDQQWRVEQEHWWFRARRHIIWSLVERYAPKVSNRRLRVCDLGCGTGGNLAVMAERHEVVGVDPSPHAIEFARRRLGDRVRQGSLPDGVDLPAASFDVVLLTDVLEHVEEDGASAATALRLLDQGGIVVATVPANPWLFSAYDERLHHFRRYTKPGFRGLWGMDDAETVLLSHFNTLLFLPAAALRMASKVMPRRNATQDVEMPGPLLNRLLMPVLKSEAKLIGHAPLPCGMSLVAVVRKRGAA